MINKTISKIILIIAFGLSCFLYGYFTFWLFIYYPNIGV